VDVRKTILEGLTEKGSIKVSDVVGLTGYSRVYVHRFFKELVEEGRILLVGKANQARYVFPNGLATEQHEQRSLRFHRILRNAGISEDIVLSEIKAQSGIYVDLGSNIRSILDYGFTEMLNNAIEHSRSDMIDALMERSVGIVRFLISDQGIGIFRNIMDSRHLANELEAIQDLLKGKQTTAPDAHSGEGIFFTSRVADVLSIRSSAKKLVFDNLRGDVFVTDIRPVRGTKVSFSLSLTSRTELNDVFAAYTDDSFEFGKTTVRVKLFKAGIDYVSRSQARRIVSGLEKFTTVELDFQGLNSIGQGFADEIFRVWQSHHPNITILPKNAGENVILMIRHVAPGLQLVYNSENPS
jgi:anti-sigma regulatory factor (Ser/Thr protein kinase)